MTTIVGTVETIQETINDLVEGEERLEDVVIVMAKADATALMVGLAGVHTLQAQNVAKSINELLNPSLIANKVRVPSLNQVSDALRVVEQFGGEHGILGKTASGYAHVALEYEYTGRELHEQCKYIMVNLQRVRNDRIVAAREVITAFVKGWMQ